MPVAKGKGLVIGETGKKVLDLVGITDVLSRTKDKQEPQLIAQNFNALKESKHNKISMNKERNCTSIKEDVRMSWIVVRLEAMSM